MNETGAGQALFSFVRHWSRRWDGTSGGERAARGRDVLAVEAVYALLHRGKPTVNDVAAELSLDQSNASRLLAHAAEAGYLTLGRSAVDQRRKTVGLTPSGHQLLADAHAWQEKVYGVLTAEWTDDEQAAFARAIRRLVAKPGMEQEMVLCP
ncbi:MAG: MarR family winged helix-turn-helix transcriptional regulator [Actinomycetota bacterium]|nr:MarR family winged helix-turn-helix transcriptional regulator [Actinomycetota bacterium]